MKILYPFSNVMGLFFPEGDTKNGGSCEFATARCLRKCCAHSPGAGQKIGFSKKKEVLDFFVNSDSDKIFSKIISELKDSNCNIFSWFASGDCPSTLTQKLFEVIKKLDQAKIIQSGFTRNIGLWRLCQKLSKDCKVLLTIETPDDAVEDGLYSFPNYEIGAIDIYCVKNNQIRRTDGCGGGYYENHKEKIKKEDSHLKMDCKACYENRTGCFNDLIILKLKREQKLKEK